VGNDAQSRVLIERIALEVGWAEADVVRLVRVGDRELPPRIDLHFPGADGQPSLDAVLEIIDRQPQCRELRISSVVDGREVRASDLKAVRIAEWVEDAFAMFAWDLECDDTGSVVRRVRRGSAAATQLAVRDVQRARRRAPDLERVAQIYKANPAAPTAAVAREFECAPRTASNYVKDAEEAGLLPKVTGRGKKRG
jgi:hypothetical protein